MNEFDGSGRETPAAAGLPRDIAPPDSARDRIVGALAERGLLRRGRVARSRIWRTAAFIGAAAALFGAGLLAGRRPSAPPAEQGSPRFVLFLSKLPGETETGEPGRVAEYKTWAAGLRGQGRLISGEKLRPEASELGSGRKDGPSEAAAQEVSGFFVLEARDLDAALALARTCPHLRHGGRITVRQIAPV